MNYSEVKELMQAGFTADEIRGMMTETESQPEPGPQPEPQPEPEPKPEPQPDNDLTEKITGLNEGIANLIKVIQASNVRTVFRDTNPEVELDKQVDDIMKSIIRQEKEETK